MNMNINTEKQNLFSLSGEGEGEAYSPYLSPLLAHNSSKDFEQQEQLIKFNLNGIELQVQNQQMQQVQPEDDIHLGLDLLVECRYRSTPEPEIMDANVSTHAVHNLEIEIEKEKKPVYSVAKKDSTKIYSIINFLVENDELTEPQIKQAGKQLYADIPVLEYIFNIMLGKLKKLRKTKQQMTKFCMRKAFKFVSDNQSHTRKKRKNSKQDPDGQNLNFQMPFRKNSTQKTMNTQFLKQVFSKPIFVQQYQRFLQDFREIIHRDNEYKIKYLSDTIQQCMNQNNLKKIQDIKRLPWTRSILNKTQQLAFSLLKFSDKNMEHQNEHQHQHQHEHEHQNQLENQMDNNNFNFHNFHHIHSPELELEPELELSLKIQPQIDPDPEPQPHQSPQTNSKKEQKQKTGIAKQKNRKKSKLSGTTTGTGTGSSKNIVSISKKRQKKQHNKAKSNIDMEKNQNQIQIQPQIKQQMEENY